jgi:hypothetical protein
MKVVSMRMFVEGLLPSLEKIPELDRRKKAS